MKKVIIAGGIFTLAIFSAISFTDITRAANQPEQPLPSIPGITTADTRPNSCVECHRLVPGPNGFDGRLTTYVTRWENGVEPELLAKAQATVPKGIKLTGKHPNVRDFVQVIPNDCMACHSSKSERVPQFDQMIHLIHLTGEGNHFIRNYQGSCTHCHKLNTDTGEWGFGKGMAEW